MSDLNRKDSSLLISLNRITNYLQHELNTLCSQYDLTQTQFSILEALHTKGDLLVGEIQKIILSTPGNVPYVIANLEKKEFVTRTTVKSDKRCCKISLTEKGKAKINEILPAHNELLTQKFDVLSEGEKNQILSLLTKFRKRLKGEYYEKNNDNKLY